MADGDNLTDSFRQLDDPRIARAKRHALGDLLILSICALRCGAESFVDMEDFGHARHDWLRRVLALPHGIPSHDTFGRVFAALDPAQFAEIFRAWTQRLRLRQSLRGELVALDGRGGGGE